VKGKVNKALPGLSSDLFRMRITTVALKEAIRLSWTVAVASVSNTSCWTQIDPSEYIACEFH
jgi:hypothetical protein